jgi:hypothetical protein
MNLETQVAIAYLNRQAQERTGLYRDEVLSLLGVPPSYKIMDGESVTTVTGNWRVLRENPDETPALYTVYED